MGELVLIGIVAVVLLVFGPLLLVVWLRRLKSTAEAEARTHGTPTLVDPMANSAGVYSRGATQLRGNGCLAAFDDQLVFVQWMPRRTLRIPRSQIVAVERIGSFLGTRRLMPMIEVRWSGPDGDDSAAFSVVDLPAWERELGPR